MGFILIEIEENRGGIDKEGRLWIQYFKLLFSYSLTMKKNKLECLFVTSLGDSLIFMCKDEVSRLYTQI